MDWVSDNVRKTRVTRAISAFFLGSTCTLQKKSTGCCRKTCLRSGDLKLQNKQKNDRMLEKMAKAGASFSQKE